MISRIAVTGAAGAIGRQVVDLLVQQEVPVAALVRESGRVVAHPLVWPIVADYEVRPDLDAALRGVDTLVLIGSDGRADRVLAHHRNLLGSARAAHVMRIVLLSSQDADPDSPFCYAPVYADTERELHDSCAEPVVIRAGLYAEFFGRWVLDAARSGELALPTRGSVAPIGRADVAHALAIAAVGAVLPLATLTGPSAFDPDALAALASRLGGREVRATASTTDAFRHRLIVAGTDPWWSYAFTTMFDGIDQGRFAGVTTDFATITGRAPQEFEAVLRSEWAD